MIELLRLVIDELWKRSVGPIFERLDGWDIGFIVGVSSVLAYWGWLWHGYCSAGERALWGAILIIIGAAWFIVRINTRKERRRRIQFAPTTTSPNNSQRLKRKKALLVSIKLLFPLLSVGVWSYAAYRTYRIPLFSSQITGIYVACFEDDVNGDYQGRIIQQMTDVIKKSRLENVDIRALPRVIKDEEERRARELGEEGRAAVVLWGKVSGPQRIRSHLTIVNTEGIVKTGSIFGNYSGLQGELSRFYQMPEDLETFQRVVTIFLAGYSRYHSQDFSAAKTYFEAAREPLIAKSTETELSPEKILLGSIDFYLATALYCEGKLTAESAERASQVELPSEIQRAIELYQEAVNLTARPITLEPLFVEPLNNMGFLLLEYGEIDKAIAVLQRANLICQKDEESQKDLCVVVKHNIGDAQRKKKNYQEAILFYRSAVEGLVYLTRTEPKRKNFHELAYLHQNLAYSYVRISEDLDIEQAKPYYEEATQELQRAKDYLSRSTTSDVQQRLYDHDVIQARILVAYKRWQDVIDLLEPIKEKLENPNAHLLLLIAYDCRKSTSDTDKAKESWSRYTSALLPGNRTEWSEGMEYHDKIIDHCQ